MAFPLKIKFSTSLVLGTIILVGIAVIYVFKTGVNVPYLDDWYYAPLLDKWFNGQLHARELFASYSHVRMALASAIQIALATFTNWNLKAAFLFIILVMWVTSGFLSCFINKNTTLQPSSVKHVLASLSPLALFLSLRNWENILLGMQINMALGIGLSIFSLFALSRNTNKYFIAALAFATGGAFSYTNALLVLPLGILILLTQKRWRAATGWGIFSITFLIAYLGNGWGGSEQMTIFGRNIISMLKYFILLASSPISLARSIISADGRPITENDLLVAAFLGIFVISSSLFAFFKFLRQPKRHPNIFFASLILWGLGSMAFVTLARENIFGVIQALSPRYAWFGSVLICGALGLLLSEQIHKTRTARLMASCLVALIFISYSSSLVSEIHMSPYRHAFMQDWADAVKNYKSLSDERIKDGLWNSKIMRERIGLIEKNHLSVFEK